MAAAIKLACRKQDVCARWGGEEFIVFLPNSSQSVAVEQAEKVRRAIEVTHFSDLNIALSLTASLGVAGTHKAKFQQQEIQANSIEALINHADKALYDAKQSGKNRVIVAN